MMWGCTLRKEHRLLNWQKQGTYSLPEPPEGSSTANTLLVRFLTSRTVSSKCVLFVATKCGNLYSISLAYLSTFCVKIKLF